MGPGPANPHPRVLQAQAQPLLGHMHPPFFKIMDGEPYIIECNIYCHASTQLIKTCNVNEVMTFQANMQGSWVLQTAVVFWGVDARLATKYNFVWHFIAHKSIGEPIFESWYGTVKTR